MGLIPFFPGGANVTGNIAVTLVLAVATFLAVNLFGTRHYWKDIFWSDVPTWLKVPIPIVPFIELVGIFTNKVLQTNPITSQDTLGNIVPLKGQNQTKHGPVGKQRQR